MPLTAAQVLVAAHPAESVEGLAMHILDPISFWGDVSPSTGELTNARSAQYGRSITGTILLIRDLRGSSSGSSVLLELIYRRIAPAAIMLDQPDAILALGALVSRELRWKTPPILRLAARRQGEIPGGARVLVSTCGGLKYR